MKTIPVLLIILSTLPASKAQDLFQNQTSTALEKVVQDYPGQFKNIIGAMLSSAQGSAAYKSTTVVMPGAVSTIIIQCANTRNQAVCWQSLLYSTDEFSLAKEGFETLFKQIENTIIKSDHGKSVIVNGVYSDPLREKLLSTIHFEMLPATGALQNLNFDMVMKFNNNHWNILLRVYNYDRKETAASMTN